MFVLRKERLVHKSAWSWRKTHYYTTCLQQKAMFLPSRHLNVIQIHTNDGLLI